MEMETEDDVAMEGDMHDSSIGAATIVTANKLQLVNDNVEMVVLGKGPEAPQ
jgi:hypothetical protein